MRIYKEFRYPDHGDRFYLGLDLGQRHDHSALAVVRRLAPDDWNPHRDSGDCPDGCRYEVQALHRYPLETSYPDIVSHVAEVCRRLRSEPAVERLPFDCQRRSDNPYEWLRYVSPAEPPELRLLVDATGVGLAVVDDFSRLEWDSRHQLIGVGITGGFEAHEKDRRRGPGGWYSQWHVPKRELVGTMQTLMQSERLKVASALPEAPTLLRELQTFRVRITDAANETFGTWREGDHDDTVLAVAMACWAGERIATIRARFL
jgi:hypothetical protein